MGMKIGIDFDDVVVDTITAWCALADEHQLPGSRSWSPRDITSWGLSEITGLSPETVRSMFLGIDYEDVEPIPDAILGIKELLEDGHEVEILSENPREYAILQWCMRRGLDVKVQGNIEDKAWYAWVNNFDVLIDDKPETLEKARAYGIHAIKFIRSWNTSMSSSWAAYTWSAVCSFIRHYNRVEKYPRYVMEDFVEASNEPALEAYGRISMMDLTEGLSATNEDGVITNERGAKQTDIGARFDLLPMKALASIARVLDEGCKKYGVENWKELSIDEINNHTLMHLIDYQEYRMFEDLEHAACRILMALELAIEEA
jgi:hypothetical protein